MRKNILTTRLAVILLSLAITLSLFACTRPPKKQTAPAQPGKAVDATELLTLLWSLPGTYHRVSHVALLEDALYVAGTPRGLDAVSVPDGMKRWKHIGKRVLDHPPTLRGNVLYLLEGGQFVTLDKESGQELSRTSSRVGSVSPVFPGGSTLMVAGGDDYLYGVHPTTGIRAWRAPVDDFIEMSTWDGKDMAYMVSSSGTLYGASAGTRKVIWLHRFSKPGTSRPTSAKDTVYIGSSNFYFYAIDSASGALKWRVSLEAHVTGTPTAAHGRVYVSTDEGILYAMDAKNGKVLWTLEGPDRVITATKTHLIYLRKTEGMNYLGVVDAASGKVHGEVTAKRYDHFVADPEAGVLYAVTRHGSILAVAHKSATKPGF